MAVTLELGMSTWEISKKLFNTHQKFFKSNSAFCSLLHRRLMLKDTLSLLDDYGFADFMALEAFLMKVELWAHHDEVSRSLSRRHFYIPPRCSRWVYRATGFICIAKLQIRQSRRLFLHRPRISHRDSRNHYSSENHHGNHHHRSTLR
ncbi:Protein of unknown function [Pyronema omphalodes CBS 100304]|uniref:Uncharacterized protein n=1 Tax=Pyronema omphalodes (strain CBS 100304) TaxID=1076935 RepID=U4LJG6_PYROM|nr:Protein of unknown function [Pyronema omphalodes CBS 100304]